MILFIISKIIIEREDIMIIDSHEHVMLPSLFQIQKLDEAKIDKAILFTTTPHVEKAKSTTLADIEKEMSVLYKLLDGKYSLHERLVKMQETINELKEAIHFAPERFLGFGAVPFGLNEQQTSEWIEKNIVQNAFKGIGEFTPGSVEQMEKLDTVFASITNYSFLPIWIHTFNPVTIEGIRVLMKLCKKYPAVSVIFGHMGGSNWMDVIRFAKEHKNAYLDLSAAFTPLSVKTALTEVPEKCLFGSDAPFGEPYLVKRLIEYVSPSVKITNMALGENIAQLLQI